MPRSARRISETSFYHIVCRGSAKQIIFEDDDDRAFFMDRAISLLDEHKASLICWCLMDNHIHFVVKTDLGPLSKIMHGLLTSYSGYFNRVHGRVGSLFEGRFKSEPIESDQHLIAAIRYVHQNPLKAGISNVLSYPWSSYDEIVSASGWADSQYVLDLFDGAEGFKSFHEQQSDFFNFYDVSDTPKTHPSDKDAKRIAIAAMKGADPAQLRSFKRDERDEVLVELKDAGLSVRQIQRLTGLSLGTISNAGR